MLITANLYVLILGLILSMSACMAGESISSGQGDNIAPAGRTAGAVAPRLLSISDLVYQGAFRVPAARSGVSSMNYSQGPVAYDASKHSVFLVGHTHQQAIAEYLVPEIRDSRTITGLAMAPPAIQKFTTVLDRMPGGNPDKLNRIGGLARYKDQLLISAYGYYDAPADNVTTHLVLRDARDLSGSAVTGPLSFRGRAHTAGWMSPVPAEWQAALGGSWLAGSSSGEPIIGRFSVGPSAFAFDPEDMSTGDTVATRTLLDFDLRHRLNDDLMNESGKNDIWTHLSRAVYGFIPPGSRTYITIGYSGGHNTSVCYKCLSRGRKGNCPGFCAKDMKDYYLMYWLWDVQDLIDVRNGDRRPYSVRPYDYGVFKTPFAGRRFGGGSYDPESNRLYLTLQRADHEQGPYDNPPIILVYSVN